MEIDGYHWERNDAADLARDDKPLATNDLQLASATDPARAAMPRTCRWSRQGRVVASRIPRGTYAVYAYVVEENHPEQSALSLAGRRVDAYHTGTQGTWRRLGPWIAAVGDDERPEPTPDGGAADPAGVEIWKRVPREGGVMLVINRIETERLVLRPFVEDDWPGFFECMIDPRVNRYLLLGEEQKTETGARVLFESVMRSYTTAEPVHSYVIADKENHFIGSCGFSPLPTPGVWECYFTLAVAYWNQGYGVESTRAMLGHLFQTAGIEQVRAYMHPENFRSERLAERLGMRRLGYERHPVFHTDALVYAMDKEAFLQIDRQPAA